MLPPPLNIPFAPPPPPPSSYACIICAPVRSIIARGLSLSSYWHTNHAVSLIYFLNYMGGLVCKTEASDKPKRELFTVVIKGSANIRICFNLII